MSRPRPANITRIRSGSLMGKPGTNPKLDGMSVARRLSRSPGTVSPNLDVGHPVVLHDGVGEPVTLTRASKERRCAQSRSTLTATSSTTRERHCARANQLSPPSSSTGWGAPRTDVHRSRHADHGKSPPTPEAAIVRPCTARGGRCNMRKRPTWPRSAPRRGAAGQPHPRKHQRARLRTPAPLLRGRTKYRLTDAFRVGAQTPRSIPPPSRCVRRQEDHGDTRRS